MGNLHPLGGRVNPFRWTFKLTEVADWSLVNDHMSGAVTPFTAEFLIAEAGAEAEGQNDLVCRRAILQPGFDLPPRFVPGRGGIALVLIGERPFWAVLPKP